MLGQVVLADGLLARQGALQRHAGGRQVWTVVLKHGGNIEGHPVGGEASLDEAGDHVGGVVAVVRDAAQPGVHGYHHQQELQQRAQQTSPSP